MKRTITLIAHNLRSCHNVGSLLRTAEGLGIAHVYLTGYTPYPEHAHDTRMPHISRKITTQIHKTALGAEHTAPWTQAESLDEIVSSLKSQGYTIAALEQTGQSKALHTYQSPEKIAVIVGREVEGLEHEVLQLADVALEIPMAGQKESFNVVQAAAMALYQLTYL